MMSQASLEHYGSLPLWASALQTGLVCGKLPVTPAFMLHGPGALLCLGDFIAGFPEAVQKGPPVHVAIRGAGESLAGSAWVWSIGNNDLLVVTETGGCQALSRLAFRYDVTIEQVGQCPRLFLLAGPLAGLAADEVVKAVSGQCEPFPAPDAQPVAVPGGKAICFALPPGDSEQSLLRAVAPFGPCFPGQEDLNTMRFLAGWPVPGLTIPNSPPGLCALPGTNPSRWPLPDSTLARKIYPVLFAVEGARVPSSGPDLILNSLAAGEVLAAMPDPFQPESRCLALCLVKKDLRKPRPGLERWRIDGRPASVQPFLRFDPGR